MFPFDPPQNIKKPKVFLMISGRSKRNIGKKSVKIVEEPTQLVITCSKLTIETLEQSVKYVKS